jgi:hypothetical protein
VGPWDSPPAPRYDRDVLVWLERSNVSLGGALRDATAQAGALPHIDDNPWAALDPNEPYDEAKWDQRRVPGLHDQRPMVKDRPVQAFVALTDCPGPEGERRGRAFWVLRVGRPA